MFNTKQTVRLMALLLGSVVAVALVTPAQAAKQPSIIVIMGNVSICGTSRQANVCWSGFDRLAPGFELSGMTANKVTSGHVR